MALPGNALADAYVVVRADMSRVGPDVSKGLTSAVDRGTKSTAGRLKDAIATPLREGFAEGVRAADPGGQAVGGRFRQGIAARLRGIGADTTKAGVDAGAGIQRGVASKMRDVAATTTTAGQRAGEGFTRGATQSTTRGGGVLARAAHSTAGQMLGAFSAVEIGMRAIDIFGGFIADARESAKIGALTAQVIRSTGGAARLTADDIGALATSVSNKTGVDDEAIQSGENLLLTFTGIRNEVGAGNDIFSQATGIMTDMSVALGQDMKSSAIQLGKALNDPIKGVTALQRVGVSFTAEQREQIKALVDSGHAMDAQKIILGELGREFGGAAAAAATPMDRLRVVVGNLGEQVGTTLLPAIDKAATILADDVAPAAAAAVTFLSQIPGPVYAVAAGVGGIILFGKAVAAIRAQALAAAEGMQAMGLSAAATGRAMSALKLGVIGVGAALAVRQFGNWVQDASKANVSTEALAGSLGRLGDQAGNTAFRDLFTRAGLGPFQVQAESATEALDQFAGAAQIAFGQGWVERTERVASLGVASRQAEGQIRDLDTALAGLASGGKTADAAAGFATLSARLREAGFGTQEITAMFPQYTAALSGAGAASTGAAGATRGLAGAQAGAQAAAAAHKKALDALTASLVSSNNATLIARGGEAGYEAAVDAARAAVAANGRTLDVHTEKGRANRAAVDALAAAGLDYLAVIQKNNGIGPVFRATLDAQWQKLYEAQRRFGATRAEARRYADQILSTPRKASTKVETPGMTAAQQAFKNLTKSITGVPSRTVTLRANADGSVTRILIAGGHVESHTMRAQGGYVSGPGGPTTDSIPARLSDGEFVVNARATAKHRPALEAINDAGRGYAAGGIVGRRVIDKVNVKNIPKDVGDVLQAGVAALMSNAYGSSGPVPKGSGVARWGAMVHRALAFLHLSQGLWDNWMRQISTESGGNPAATQGSGVKDINYYTGNLAQGLLQTIPPTFNAYHVSGTSWNIHDAWANMLAAMNYASHRYGGAMEGVIGHGHGYAAGTRAAAPGWAWVGEGGRELVNFRGGETVKTAAASRAMDGAAGGPVRLHPDTVAALGAAFAAASGRQAVLLDGRVLAGHVDRALGLASMSVRG